MVIYTQLLDSFPWNCSSNQLPTYTAIQIVYLSRSSESCPISACSMLSTSISLLSNQSKAAGTHGHRCSKAIPLIFYFYLPGNSSPFGPLVQAWKLCYSKTCDSFQ